MSIEIEKIRTDRFSMRFFRFGKGEKTMVILPGLSVQSVTLLADAVRKEYEIFEEEFTVFVFDRREELPPSFSVREMAEDTAEAFSSLGLRDVFLFGASQGGMIALSLAIERPDLVSRLALGSTAAEVTDDSFETIEKWIGLAKAKDPVGLYLAFGEAIFPTDFFEKYRSALVLAAESVSDEELDRFVVLAQGTKGFSVIERLCEIRCPVLAVGARDDKVLGPDAAEKIAEKLKDDPGFQLYMYDGFGHAAYDTAPDYRERILRFFAGK